MDKAVWGCDVDLHVKTYGLTKLFGNKCFTIEQKTPEECQV